MELCCQLPAHPAHLTCEAVSLGPHALLQTFLEYQCIGGGRELFFESKVPAQTATVSASCAGANGGTGAYIICHCQHWQGTYLAMQLVMRIPSLMTCIGKRILERTVENLNLGLNSSTSQSSTWSRSCFMPWSKPSVDALLSVAFTCAAHATQTMSGT